ncbi:MAG TPA: trigger factor [Ktedonobacteraceae bacterium]|nr:trigger factor [Ktedonobacteraceae bacterium]
MKVSVETLPSSEAVVNVDFSWEELEKASDKAYRKLVQKVDIQGFRRGKAPRSLLERKLGKEYIYQEGLDELMTETYRNTVKEHNIVPLTQPELDAPILEMGQPYHFSLKVPILSPVELGDYKSLHFERPTTEITSEEVEKELESLRTRQASWEEVERPAQIGDRVTMDLKLSSEEQTISDLKDNPFELTDERHGLFTGMDEQIVGMQKGESKTFSTTIPEDYPNEKLGGKAANYEVKLHKVEFKELPELDDALAMQVSNEEYSTVEDLRKAVSDQLLDAKKRKVRDELREQVLKAVVDQATMTLHPVLIEDEAREMMHQMSHVLEQQHMSLDQYLMLIKKSEAEYLESLKPDAERRVQQQLVLDELGKKEEIKVSLDEVESLYRLYAQMGQPLPQTEEQVRSIANSMQREKTITRLLELTTDPDPDEVQEASTEEAVEAVADDETSIENAVVAAQTAEAIEESEKAAE